MGDRKQLGIREGVRARGKSSIQIDFYYRGVRCRERVKLPPTPKNINYAAKLKASIEIEIGRGEFDYSKHFPDSPRAKMFSSLPGDALLMKTYLNDWLPEESHNIKHSTALGYSKILKYHLVPSFGNLAVSELRRKHVYEWVTAHADLSAKRVRNVLSVLRIALDAAVERELIEANPLLGFKVRRRSGGRSDDVDALNTEERAAVLAQLQGQDRNLIQFAFWTGLRTSELIALDWSDIDWVRGVAVISRVLTQGMDKPEDGTKTDAGHREVKLLLPALQALMAQKTYTFFKGEEVFQNPRTGARWTGDKSIRQGMWASALRKAGIRYRNPYQTRHTYASMMLMAGEHVMWVAKQMGHTDWSLTAKRYSRWITSDMPDAGQRAVKLWSQPGHNPSANNSKESGEGGIRFVSRIMRSASCRFDIANPTKIAIIARKHCPKTLDPLTAVPLVQATILGFCFPACNPFLFARFRLRSTVLLSDLDSDASVDFR